MMIGEAAWSLYIMMIGEAAWKTPQLDRNKLKLSMKKKDCTLVKAMTSDFL